MKAFLSDPEARLAHRTYRAMCEDLPVALAEAQRILAETEPEQLEYRHLGPGHWSAFEIGEQYPNTSPCSDFGSALAEALAGFVEG